MNVQPDFERTQERALPQLCLLAEYTRRIPKIQVLGRKRVEEPESKSCAAPYDCDRYDNDRGSGRTSTGYSATRTRTGTYDRTSSHSGCTRCAGSRRPGRSSPRRAYVERGSDGS